MVDAIPASKQPRRRETAQKSLTTSMPPSEITSEESVPEHPTEAPLSTEGQPNSPDRRWSLSRWCAATKNSGHVSAVNLISGLIGVAGVAFAVWTWQAAKTGQAHAAAILTRTQTELFLERSELLQARNELRTLKTALDQQTSVTRNIRSVVNNALPAPDLSVPPSWGRGLSYTTIAIPDVGPLSLAASNALMDNARIALEKGDHETALRFLKRVADDGHISIRTLARTTVGDMYLSGDGSPQNSAAGIMYETLAAKDGDDSAQFFLGQAYFCGYFGLSASHVEGITWLQKSADQGNVKAAFTLGNIFENGLFGKKNTDNALQWYRKADSHGGYPEAEEAIKRLSTRGG